MENQYLPVADILKRSVLLPLVHIKDVIRLTYPYILFSLLASFFVDDNEVFQSLYGVLIYLPMSIVFSLWAAVNCHRIFLKPVEEIEKLSAFQFSKAHRQFFIAIVVLMLLTILIAIPYSILFAFIVPKLGDFTQSTPNWIYLGLLAYLPLGYFVARWSFMLPDAAVNSGKGYSWSWELTKGQSLNVFILISFVPFITAALQMWILTGFGEDSIAVFFNNMLLLIFTVIELCILSLSYAWLVNYKENLT